MQKCTKAEVNYRKATGKQRCGNCSMLRERTIDYTCTLVMGVIKRDDTCDEWSKKDA
jgi:hypothetical protein